RHRALDRLTGEQRNDHHPLVVVDVGALDLDRARVARRVVDELGAARLQDVADDTLSDFDGHLAYRLADLADRDDRTIRLAARIGEEDRTRVCGQQILRVARDAVHHRREVERRRNVTAHFGEGRGLTRAAL